MILDDFFWWILQKPKDLWYFEICLFSAAFNLFMEKKEGFVSRKILKTSTSIMITRYNLETHEISRVENMINVSTVEEDKYLPCSGQCWNHFLNLWRFSWENRMLGKDMINTTNTSGNSAIDTEPQKYYTFLWRKYVFTSSKVIGKFATSLLLQRALESSTMYFWKFFCVDVYTLLCPAISFRATHCMFETVWLGIFSLNPDEGFAWSDGSPVSILIFHHISLLKILRDLYIYFLAFCCHPHQIEHQSCKRSRSC